MRSAARAASQCGLRPEPRRRWSATLSPAYVGVSWPTKPTLARRASRPVGRAPSTSISPADGVSRPTARWRKVLLPAPLGPTSPTTRPAGTSRVQSESAHLRPYFLPRPWASSTVLMRSPPAHRGAKGGQEQRLDALVVEPGSPGLGQPLLEAQPQRPVRGEGVVGQRPGHEGAHALTCRHQSLVLELPVGLEHGVGVDGEVRHHVLDRRQLVALAEQPEPERPADLLDQLEVRRDAGPPVQVELDHQPSIPLGN